MPARQSKRSKTLPIENETAPTPARVLPWLERHSRLISLLLVLFASVRIAATYDVFSHTSDEPAHLACGMEWLDKGVYRWEPQHPPLSRVAVALVPYLSGSRSQGTPFVDQLSMSREGMAILDAGGHYDQTLTAARFGILPFFWVGCLAVFVWARQHFNGAVAALAVFFFSFLPPVLAHAGLATTDMALTAFLAAAFFCGVRWLQRPGYGSGIWFGASMGLAMLSKFSVMAFFPACAALAIVWYLATERPAWGPLAGRLIQAIPSLALAVAAACILIWAGYRFSLGKGGLPAPELFQGIRDVMKHNAEGHPSYLLGQRSRTGFWYFYPVVLAVKTPLAFLGLLAGGVVLVLRRRERYPLAFLPLAFSAGILAVGLFTHINIGVRHILPIYAGFSLLAALATGHLLEGRHQRKWFPIAAAVLLFWFMGSSLWNHPDYLAYFNELGGSDPAKILVDSDLDWGQDAKRLARRLRQAHATEVIYVTPFLGNFEKEFGFPHVEDQLDVVSPSPGWIAIGETALRQRRLGLLDSYPELVLWPDRVAPLEKVGRSILLWHFTPAPGSAGR